MDEERRVLVEWRQKTAEGHQDHAEWVDADYIAQGGLSLGYAITGHKSQGLTVQEALVYGPGAQANALYTMLSRDKRESHLFLPLSVYETDADRARAGEPETDQEQLDRAVAGLLREIESGTEERMVLTELPDHAVPDQVREVVETLPGPRAPRSQDEPEDAPQADARGPHRDGPPVEQAAGPIRADQETGRPYGHLSSSALRDAIRKAAAATRSTRAAAEEAETAAERAEQLASVDQGPNVLDLHRRHQDLRSRAAAIIEARSLAEAIEERTSAHEDQDRRLHEIELRLTAAGRFGRPALRGSDRAAAETERLGVIRARDEIRRELDELAARLRRTSAVAGPTAEHASVLAEVQAPRHEDTLLRSAREQDRDHARQLRAMAERDRGVAARAARRDAELGEELRRRPPDRAAATAEHPRRRTAGSIYANEYGHSEVACCAALLPDDAQVAPRT
ncbi:hypothetical protein ACFWMQ_08605 [Streptomyces sp. NPDC058372]|uniref:C-terminal helicase domain-containing protein n=1 Tax=Streptomyces sp. NPDC058372 TaxID=3346464 RepID=UPI00365A9EBD